jgi:hypothetical protein
MDGKIDIACGTPSARVELLHGTRASSGPFKAGEEHLINPSPAWGPILYAPVAARS